MRPKTARPYGQSVNCVRAISMLMAIVVLWMLYGRLKYPATWGIAFEDRASVDSAPVETPVPEMPERLVPGPNDQHPDELAAIQNEFAPIIDGAAMKPREMDAYWRLVDWSLTQPFSEMEQRANDDVPLTQLWEQPEIYRGKLIRLRMHVRRVLEYPAPKNSSDVKKIYEAWGWTDESRSFPYVVVISDPPAGLPVGTEMHAEVVFVGYFLKVITFNAVANLRGAPLLVGRAKLLSQPVAMKASKFDPWIIPLVLIGGTVFVGYSIWSSLRSRRKTSVKMLPNELSVVGPSDGDDAKTQFAHLDEAVSVSPTSIPVGNFRFAGQAKDLIDAKTSPE